MNLSLDQKEPYISISISVTHYQVGDHIKITGSIPVFGQMYDHHGLVSQVDPDTKQITHIIHYQRFRHQEKHQVQESTLEEFLEGRSPELIELVLDREKEEKEEKEGTHQKKKKNGILYSREESIVRARSKLGETKFHVLKNNCEHFVSWCQRGKHKSKQISLWSLLASSAVAVLATSLLLSKSDSEEEEEEETDRDETTKKRS